MNVALMRIKEGISMGRISRGLIEIIDRFLIARLLMNELESSEVTRTDLFDSGIEIIGHVLGHKCLMLKDVDILSKTCV